jgi:cupin fold WbuC family metalloprotein
MKIFSSQYFDQLLYAASRSKRLRVHANVHDSYTDQCQKLFNAICVDSYIRPHRHSLDPKEECLIAVRGLFGLIEFSDHGGIESITLFGSEKYSQQLSIASGVELPGGVWHTVVSLVENSILFEVKSGPFDPALAKELAPWAPEEGGELTQEYLVVLRREVQDQLEEISR